MASYMQEISLNTCSQLELTEREEKTVIGSAASLRYVL